MAAARFAASAAGVISRIGGRSSGGVGALPRKASGSLGRPAQGGVAGRSSGGAQMLPARTGGTSIVPAHGGRGGVGAAAGGGGGAQAYRHGGGGGVGDRGRMGRAADWARDHVRNRPLTAAGGAAGVGFLAGNARGNRNDPPPPPPAPPPGGGMGMM